MKTIFSPLDNWSYKSIWRTSVFVIFSLSGIYIAFDGKVALDSFFVIPVAIVSWYGSSKSGICLSLVSSALLAFMKVLIFDVKFGDQLILFYWLPVLISYSCIAILITNFRKVHSVEVDAADTDFLTGVCNSRSFFVELANELVRSHRYNHMFSLAFLDIDDFKNINDTKGHEVGDKLLVEVANCLKSLLLQNGRSAGNSFAERIIGFLGKRLTEVRLESPTFCNATSGEAICNLTIVSLPKMP